MHKVITQWNGNMSFESILPDGKINIDVPAESGGDGNGMRPKALMLTSLAGCSGLDVASLIKKMRLDVEDFKIVTEGHLTETEPQIYDNVLMEYHFYGANLNEEKLARAVELSVEKYCGVMHMFKSFADVKIEIFYHKN